MATLPAIQPLRVPDPLQGYAAVQNILASQQQQQVNALAMEKARRDAEREAALTNYLTSANLSTPEGVAGLTRFGKPGLEYQTALGQAETARLTRAKTQADLITSKLTQGRQVFAMAPTPAALADAAKAQFSDPVLGPVLTRMNLSPDSLAAYIAQKSATPEGFTQVKLEFASTADQMVDQLKGQLERFERGRLLGDETTPATPTAPTALAVEPVAAPAAAATPTMEAAPAMAVEPTLDERGVNRAAWMAKAGLEEDVAPAPVANILAAPPAPAVNVLAAAPAVQVAGPTEMPTAAAPSAAVQEQIASLRAQQRRALAAGEKDIAAYFGSQITSLEAQTDPTKRYKVVGNQMFDFLTQQFVTPPALPARAGAPAPEARTKPAGLPRAPSGYRYTDGGNLEPIPGGPAARREAAAGAPSAAPAEGPSAKPPRPMTEAEIAKRRDLVGKEFRNAATALQNLEDTLDSSYQVRTAPGLSRATGYTGTMLPSFPGGAAAQAETRLDNLRGKITAMGKATAAMTGAIGSIANQEWKILADQIAVIDPKKGVQPLTEQLDALERQAEAAMERIRNGYSRIYGEDFSRFPQLRDLPAPKSVRPRAAAPGATPAGNTVTLPDGRVMNFPDAAAAAAFKKAAGL